MDENYRYWQHRHDRNDFRRSNSSKEHAFYEDAEEYDEFFINSDSPAAEHYDDEWVAEATKGFALEGISKTIKDEVELTAFADSQASSELLSIMADAMMSWFTEHGGINYVETEVHTAGGTPWVMNIAPKGKLTPHAFRIQAEQKTAIVEAILQELAEKAETLDEQFETQQVSEDTVLRARKFLAEVIERGKS